jgi:hypothetical protein
MKVTTDKSNQPSIQEHSSRERIENTNSHQAGFRVAIEMFSTGNANGDSERSSDRIRKHTPPKVLLDRPSFTKACKTAPDGQPFEQLKAHVLASKVYRGERGWLYLVKCERSQH